MTDTASAVEMPLFDPGQQGISEMPTYLATDVVPTVEGMRAGLTWRIPNTTVSVLLTRDALGSVIAQLQELHGKMPGLALPGKDF